jgi:photoactive yellow protein
MSIVNESVLKKLPSLSAAELDALSIGVVKVDDQGVIQMYNKEEGRIGNVNPASVIGKNFFTQVAPCTNNRLFFGKFKEGVSKGQLSFSMPYTFTYKIKPTNVMIQMYRDPDTSSNWVLVKQR